MLRMTIAVPGESLLFVSRFIVQASCRRL